MGTTNNHLSLINNPFAIVPLHLSRVLYKSTLFMQNKANFQKSQANVTSLVTTDYENIANWTLGENKPKQTQFQTFCWGCRTEKIMFCNSLPH